MGRPRKYAQPLEVDLRIPMTREQKALIDEALSIDKIDMTTWARPILLKAAQERIDNHKKNSSQ